MNKFSSSTAFSFVPINSSSHRFDNQPVRYDMTVQEIINKFEKSSSVSEVDKIKPEVASPIKEEAKLELLKEEEEVTVITSNIQDHVIEPIVELTEVYPKENDINIEQAIQKEIKLSHQGFKESKMRLVVDEIILNLRKQKSKSGWST